MTDDERRLKKARALQEILEAEDQRAIELIYGEKKSTAPRSDASDLKGQDRG